MMLYIRGLFVAYCLMIFQIGFLRGTFHWYLNFFFILFDTSIRYYKSISQYWNIIKQLRVRWASLPRFTLGCTELMIWNFVVVRALPPHRGMTFVITKSVYTNKILHYMHTHTYSTLTQSKATTTLIKLLPSEAFPGEFKFTPANVNIVSAVQTNCSK